LSPQLFHWFFLMVPSYAGSLTDSGGSQWLYGFVFITSLVNPFEHYSCELT
jgi:hypothetical protein